MKAPSKQATTGNYHHGDLRNALIIAAAELIEESGSLDFSVADAARRARVSTAAPYRHFRGKQDLLTCVATLGFLDLYDGSTRISERYRNNPSDCIVEMAKYYVDFVIAHRSFYDLMWGDAGITPGKPDPESVQVRGFQVLVDAVRRWCDAEGIVGCDALDLSVKLWASALGLATLAINRQLAPVAGQVNIDEVLTSATLTFLEGIRREAGPANQTGVRLN